MRVTSACLPVQRPNTAKSVGCANSPSEGSRQHGAGGLQAGRPHISESRSRPVARGWMVRIAGRWRVYLVASSKCLTAAVSTCVSGTERYLLSNHTRAGVQHASNSLSLSMLHPWERHALLSGCTSRLVAPRLLRFRTAVNLPVYDAYPDLFQDRAATEVDEESRCWKIGFPTRDTMPAPRTIRTLASLYLTPASRLAVSKTPASIPSTPSLPPSSHVLIPLHSLSLFAPALPAYAGLRTEQTRYTPPGSRSRLDALKTARRCRSGQCSPHRLKTIAAQR
ncbi:hypothetical protein QBC47DRAFT_95522 [Echria macrotheca]|uniref:Uncharacterized protein n=1 Tax=Echria macrotheca TaxID=438768 RepID=A0AAJ0BKY5_9PEZI|nr:hypothetical protein QBC47DRAFT_95522 [Echria macrotheca]